MSNVIQHWRDSKSFAGIHRDVSGDQSGDR